MPALQAYCELPCVTCILKYIAHTCTHSAKYLTVSDEFKMVADPCIGDALRSMTRTNVRSGHVRGIIGIRAFMLVEPLVGDT